MRREGNEAKHPDPGREVAVRWQGDTGRWRWWQPRSLPATVMADRYARKDLGNARENNINLPAQIRYQISMDRTVQQLRSGPSYPAVCLRHINLSLSLQSWQLGRASMLPLDRGPSSSCESHGVVSVRSCGPAACVLSYRLRHLTPIPK